MLPPSATVGVAVNVIVVSSMVSVIVVIAGAGFIVVGMPLPLTPVIVALTFVGSLYTSSLAGTGTATVPVSCPGRIVIVCPLESVTSSGVVGARVTEAV